MTPPVRERVWAPRVGWALVLAALAAFVWGMNRRARLEAVGEEVLRMLFVPSVEQGTLVERSDELARFIRQDSGLKLQTEVPTSYAAVIQALGAGQADVAWMPAFAYVIANARYGAQAKLQVVRSVDRYGVVVGRSTAGEPESLAELAGRRVAFPRTAGTLLRRMMREELDAAAPGWIEVEAADDKEAMRLLLDRPLEIDAAVSGHVYSGPNDFVGNGRRELEYDRPGTMQSTRILFKTERSVAEDATTYHGCILTRTDSAARRIGDLNGARFAFSDETSTSGHIFARMLLDRHDVRLGRIYFAGGHPNVVQAVWDGKADGGATFYSPPSEQQRRDGVFVGDARYILLRRMPTVEAKQQFLSEVRVLALTDPIPNDLCAVRRGFPEEIWQRFEASLQRYLLTEEGREVYDALLTAIGAAPTDDAAFDGFRQALESAGMSAEGLLDAAERKLEQQRRASEGGP